MDSVINPQKNVFENNPLVCLTNSSQRPGKDEEDNDSKLQLPRKQEGITDTGPHLQLIKEEERERGRVGFDVYWSYITAVYAGMLVVVAYLAQSCFQVCCTNVKLF